jgi:hypothetical protein
MLWLRRRIGQDGCDKVADHHGADTEYIVSADMSCLMHQKGCAARVGLDIRFIHIAEVGLHRTRSASIAYANNACSAFTRLHDASQ